MTDKLKNFKEVYGISDSLLEAANKISRLEKEKISISKHISNNSQFNKDQEQVNQSKDPKFINKMINKWGSRAGAWLNHPALKEDMETLEELSKDTLGSYIKKAKDKSTDISNKLWGSGEKPSREEGTKLAKRADKIDRSRKLAVSKYLKKDGFE